MLCEIPTAQTWLSTGDIIFFCPSSKLSKVSINSCNGLASNRWQDINCIKKDPVQTTYGITRPQWAHTMVITLTILVDIRINTEGVETFQNEAVRLDFYRNSLVLRSLEIEQEYLTMHVRSKPAKFLRKMVTLRKNRWLSNFKQTLPWSGPIFIAWERPQLVKKTLHSYYGRTSNIRGTKSQQLNVFRLVF